MKRLFFSLACLLASGAGAASAGDTLHILMVGQSNMHGALGKNIKVPMPAELRNGTGERLSRTWLTWYGKPGQANAYHLHVVRPYAYSVGIWGPEVFGGWTLASPDRDVVMTKATKGGVPLNYFLPGEPGWKLVVDNHAITVKEAAEEGLEPPGEIDVLWWGHGESGSKPAGSYYENMVTIIKGLKEEFESPDMKVVFMGMGKKIAEDNEADLAFKRYVAGHPETSLYVSGKEFDLRIDHVEEFPDEAQAGPHYSAIGMRALGIRMASATLALTDPDSDADGDGRSALVEFHAETDPATPDGRIRE